jgi:hypothetical protein
LRGPLAIDNRHSALGNPSIFHWCPDAAVLRNQTVPAPYRKAPGFSVTYREYPGQRVEELDAGLDCQVQDN